MIPRREFITLLGSAAVWPVAASAQQGDRVRRIGVLAAGDETSNPNISRFIEALAGLGWADGRNVRMDLRWYGADNNRSRALAQELVGLQPDIIVTTATPTTVAVQKATQTIPIVFATVSDPVASGRRCAARPPGREHNWLCHLRSVPGRQVASWRRFVIVMH